MNSTQKSFIKYKSLPLILKALEQQKLLQKFFQDLRANFIKEREQEKGKFAQVMVRVEQIKEQNQIQKEKDKGGILKKLITVGKAYQRVRRVLFLLHVVRDFRDQMRAKFQDINRTGNPEQMQNEIYRRLDESQEEIKDTMEGVMFPIYFQMSRMIDEKLNVNGYSIMGRFFWFIIKRIFLPDWEDPIDVGLWILSIVAGAFSGGLGFLAGAAVRVAGVIRKLNKVFKVIKGLKALPVFRGIATGVSRYRGLLRGERAVRATRVATVAGIISQSSHQLRRTMGLLKGFYTGIDLYNVDEDDVREMTQYYKERTDSWGNKAIESMTGKLERFGEDISLVTNIFREAGQDFRKSMVLTLSSSGFIKVLSKKYNTAFKIKIIGENNSYGVVLNVIKKITKKFNDMGRMVNLFLYTGEYKKSVDLSEMVRTNGENIYYNAYRINEENTQNISFYKKGNLEFGSGDKKIQIDEIKYHEQGNQLRRYDWWYKQSGVNARTGWFFGVDFSYFSGGYSQAMVRMSSEWTGEYFKVFTNKGDASNIVKYDSNALYFDLKTLYKVVIDPSKKIPSDLKRGRTDLYLWDYMIYNKHEQNKLLKREKTFQKNAKKLNTSAKTIYLVSRNPKQNLSKLEDLRK